MVVGPFDRNPDLRRPGLDRHQLIRKGDARRRVHRQSQMKIEVCILAGGKSRRMRRNKAALELDGMPLLEWSKRIARGAGLPYRVIDRDIQTAAGPVSGIATAQ